jgi:hypothetical protein
MSTGDMSQALEGSEAPGFPLDGATPIRLTDGAALRSTECTRRTYGARLHLKLVSFPAKTRLGALSRLPVQSNWHLTLGEMRTHTTARRPCGIQRARKGFRHCSIPPALLPPLSIASLHAQQFAPGLGSPTELITLFCDHHALQRSPAATNRSHHRSYEECNGRASKG